MLPTAGNSDRSDDDEFRSERPRSCFIGRAMESSANAGTIFAPRMSSTKAC